MIVDSDNSAAKMTFWQFFRLIFVAFCLYLMGDAFSRWDGFSYYASFFEFLPTVALALILWGIVSVITAILVWMLFRFFCRCSTLLGIEIVIEHCVVYSCIFILSGALAWKGKKLIWPYLQTTFQIKLVVFLCISALSAIAAWLIREKTKRCVGIVQERITPLVWLFGILIIIAVPLVSYFTWFEDEDDTVSRTVIEGSSLGQNRPNIVLVTFDALSARNMSAYGYDRGTTPFINKWAKEATLFTKAEAGSNFTTPAVASLMTGKRVWTHQTYHIAGTKPVRGRIESLPAVLKENGYFNIALVVNPFASVRILGLSDSFDIAPPANELGISFSLFGWKFGIVDKVLYRAFGEQIKFHNWITSNEFILSKLINLISRNVTETEAPPHKAFNRFLDIIDNNHPKPFFAWIHIFPPHDPYLPPESFRGKFNISSELRMYKLQEQLIKKSYIYLFRTEPYPDQMQPDINLMRDYYDEFVSYIDETFKNFIGELNKRRLEDTVIILSADHGESFEHGYFTHGGPFLYEQVTHIPLIIKEPEQNSGDVVMNAVAQIDIAATILDLAAIPVPSWMEGRSLIPLMRGEPLDEKPVFSMNFEGNPSRGNIIENGSIAVWDGDYKLIHYLITGETLLFNLKHDPTELNNISSEEYETEQRLLALIRDNLKKANDGIRRQKYFK